MVDQQLILAMQNIGTAMTAINTTMQTLQTSSQKNVMQKPAKYNGRTSADAQRFMATFAAWADGESSLHNVTAEQRVRDESKWICTALLYLEDDAAIWATPSLEALGTGNPPLEACGTHSKPSSRSASKPSTRSLMPRSTWKTCSRNPRRLGNIMPNSRPSPVEPVTQHKTSETAFTNISLIASKISWP